MQQMGGVIGYHRKLRQVYEIYFADESVIFTLLSYTFTGAKLQQKTPSVQTVNQPLSHVLYIQNNL